MRIALFQPEIPGNVGAILRLAACYDVGVDIIEPTGFIWSDVRFRRTAMDYADHVTMRRHVSWVDFLASEPARLVLLTTKGDCALQDFAFDCADVLLFGQESAGVPADVAAACSARVRIPISADVRSLNVAVSAGIGLFEALRQTGELPG